MARSKKKVSKGRKKATKKVARRRITALIPRGPAVPRRKKGESYVAYHDRLSDLIYEAENAGDFAMSETLQRAAGELARKQKTIPARRKVDKARRGPGTYPWYQCVDDQTKRHGDSVRAARVCGRIRADSRARYPIYWSVRGLGRRRNPEAEQDFSITVDGDGTVWHFWVQDNRKSKLAATSSKPYRSEQTAISAAKRAAKQWEQRYYAPKPQVNGGKKAAKSRGRLPSVLTRM